MNYIIVDFEMNPINKEYVEERNVCRMEIIENLLHFVHFFHKFMCNSVTIDIVVHRYFRNKYLRIRRTQDGI